jgi:glycosyltransferase involved in cell wall biosynthesis
MRKIVIVMTYFERWEQLRQTLKSISNSKHNNFEVVIVDDCSINHLICPFFSDFKLTILRTKGKCWTNPEPAYNIGLNYAMSQKPEIIIIQNAECYHVNDILTYADQHITNENYISFSCFSLDEASTFKPHDITALCMTNEIGASFDGQLSWYNHPLHRPVGYDFCSAISTKNMLTLNGYDERLSNGCGYGDDFLLQRIKMLGLKVVIPAPPAPFVAHQWHYNGDVPANKGELVEKNRLLYLQLLREGQPRAEHKYTPDLCVCY